MMTSTTGPVIPPGQEEQLPDRAWVAVFIIAAVSIIAVAAFALAISSTISIGDLQRAQQGSTTAKQVAAVSKQEALDVRQQRLENEALMSEIAALKGQVFDLRARLARYPLPVSIVTCRDLLTTGVTPNSAGSVPPHCVRG